jgi:hypothetical protein
MGDFLHSFKTADVVEVLYGRGKAAMKTKELVLHHCGEGKVVEELG